MKKVFAVTTVVLFMFVLFATPAMAGSSHMLSHNPNNDGVIAGGNVASGNTNNGIISGGNVNNQHNNNHHNMNGNIINEGGEGGDADIGDVSNDANNSNVNDNSVNIEGDTFNEAKEKSVTIKGNRGFANQVEMSYVPTPGYNGPARHDANVQDIKTIIMYKDTFTRADVERLLKGVNIDAKRTVDKVAEEDRKSVKVIFIAPDRSAVTQCAIITTKATSKDTATANVLGAAILSAIDVGADVLLITAEGLSTELSSFGWGIGLAYSRATIAVDERSGGIGSGGLGISGGTAGYRSLPWIQSIALSINKKATLIK